MCSPYHHNREDRRPVTGGREILAPGNVYDNNIIFNPTPILDDYGGHISSNPNRSLDCSFKRRPPYSFKFACSDQNCNEPGGCNCFNPEDMQYVIGTMGVPRVHARFDRYG